MQPSPLHCPLCGHASPVALSAVPSDVALDAPTLGLLECRACGLAWQYPVLRSVEQSVDRHTRKYQEKDQGSYFDPERRRAIAGAEMAFIGQLRGEPGTLLDVGAGDGTFVSVAAESGWRCVGVDPAAQAREFAPSQSGGTATLLRGTLDALDPQRRFDVVSMWDVIEHLDDPEPVLSACADRLDADGMLVIETGNFQSEARLRAGKTWWGYAADHRWYFSPPNLVRLLKRFGFAHVAHGNRTLRPWWKGTQRFAGPALGATLRRMVRAPGSAVQAVRLHRELRDAAERYGSWGGLPIVTIVATRRPVDPRVAALLTPL